MVKPPEGEGVKVRSEVSPALKGYKKRKSGTSAKAKSRAKKQRKRGVQALDLLIGIWRTHCSGRKILETLIWRGLTRLTL